MGSQGPPEPPLTCPLYLITASTIFFIFLGEVGRVRGRASAGGRPRFFWLLALVVPVAATSAGGWGGGAGVAIRLAPVTISSAGPPLRSPPACPPMAFRVNSGKNRTASTEVDKQSSRRPGGPVGDSSASPQPRPSWTYGVCDKLKSHSLMVHSCKEWVPVSPPPGGDLVNQTCHVIKQLC